jgi:phosphatidyl-myo-inositol alpha-mannosyltransferase
MATGFSTGEGGHVAVRVAIACPYAWDDPGGVQVHIRDLAEYLQTRGHEVLVLAPVRHPPTQRWVVGVGSPVDITYNASNAPIDPRPWSRRRVRHELARFMPDVVHAHQPTAPSTGLWATLESRAPVVGTFHTGSDRARLYDMALPLLRPAVRRLAVRIAVSERAAAFERGRIGGRFRIVPNGVDVSRFANARPAELGPGPKVLFVGRLDERKGFPYAVDAFERLAATHEDVRLIVVGEGRDAHAVERLPVSVRARVSMLGHVANADLAGVHGACDVFCAPALGGESFGIVLVEAMAAGLPVVASRTPGYDEVVTDGVDGLLVAPRDVEGLATALARVLDEPSAAAALRDAGRQRAATYDWAVVGEQIEECYAEALAVGPPPLR